MNTERAPSSGEPARSTRPAMLVALVIVLVHAALVWGHPSTFWGDYGRWLHEVDQVAHGAAPYRDVYWAFPPLAMWLIGGITRVIGSDLAQIWMITTSIAACLALVYGAVVARLVPGRLAVLVSATGMMLGVAYSQQDSAPLALGMYSPAVPVAILCLLGTLLAFLRDWERPSLAGAAGVGVLAALGFLTKHDVWFPSLWLAFAAAFLTPTGRDTRLSRAVAAGGGFALVAGAGLTVLAIQYGRETLDDILTGFGHVAEFAGINLPTLSMFVVEAAAFGLVMAGVAAVAWLGGSWRGRSVWLVGGAGLVVAAAAMAVWLWQAEVTGRELLANGPRPMYTVFEDMLRPVDASPMVRFRKAFGILRVQLLRHIIPLFVPLTALVVLVVRRRQVVDQRLWRLLAILLVAALALRGRRMVAFSEWSELLLEVPVYVTMLVLLWPEVRRHSARTLALGCAVLMLVALRMNWQSSVGPGTRRARSQEVGTPRGRVHLAPGIAMDLAYIRDLARSVDSSGRRPIFAFGYSAGLSYFTGRPTVNPLTQGFRLSPFRTADRAYQLAAAMKRRLLVVDNRAFVDAVPTSEFAPWRWTPKMQVNAYQRVDRPLFERLIEGCRLVTLPERRSAIFTMYDCAQSNVARPDEPSGLPASSLRADAPVLPS